MAVMFALLDRLNVRQKLLVYFLVPVVCMLVLGTAGVVERLQKMSRGDQFVHHLQIVARLVELTEQLQQERAATLLFLVDEQRQVMDESRGRTDTLIDDISVEFTEVSRSELLAAFRDQPFLASLMRLPGVRRIADEGNVDALGMYYTLVDESLSLITALDMHIELDSARLAADQLNEILFMEEQVLVERDLVYLVARWNEVTAIVFQIIASADARRDLFRRNADLDDPLFRDVGALRDEIIADAILWQRRAELAHHLADTFTAEGLSPEVLDDRLRRIEMVLTLDERAAIGTFLDDPTRLTGMLGMEEPNHAERWWSMTGARASALRAERRAMQWAIEAELTRQRVSAGDDLVVYFATAASGVVLSLLLGYVILLRLSRGINHLADGLARMRQNGEFHPLPALSGKDELTYVVGSVNEMIRERVDYEVREQRLQEDLLSAQQRLNEDLEDRVRVRTRQLRDARQHAETASQAKSQFLGNISHHVRTPLNAILGYSQLLTSESGRSAEDVRKLRSIQSGGEQLLAMMDDILTLVHLEQGDLVAEPAVTDVEGLLHRVVDTHRSLADRKGLEVLIDCADLAPRMLMIDADKLHRALNAVLENAVKFTDLGRVRIDAAFSEDVLSICVRDTGIGFPTDEDPNSWTSTFVQAVPGCDERGGTGLGLSLARSMMQLQDGELVIRSDPGSRAGYVTAVTLRLPVQVADGLQTKTTDPVDLAISETPVTPSERSGQEVVSTDQREWLDEQTIMAAADCADLDVLTEVLTQVERRDRELAAVLAPILASYDYQRFARMLLARSGV